MTTVTIFGLNNQLHANRIIRRIPFKTSKVAKAYSNWLNENFVSCLKRANT